MTYWVEVTVEARTPPTEWHHDDLMRWVPGTYHFSVEAATEKGAGEKGLDRFHESVPVSGLDHFTITTTKIRGPQVGDLLVYGRKKGERLERGHPRRMTDARCAWRGMTDAQRAEFLEWVANEQIVT